MGMMNNMGMNQMGNSNNSGWGNNMSNRGGNRGIGGNRGGRGGGNNSWGNNAMVKSENQPFHGGANDFTQTNFGGNNTFPDYGGINTDGWGKQQGGQDNTGWDGKPIKRTNAWGRGGRGGKKFKSDAW